MRRKSQFKLDIGLSNINIKNVTNDDNGNYHIHVSCDATSAKCKKCGKIITTAYGQCQESIIEHLPILDQKVFIHVKWPRFICKFCDDTPTTSFHPDWLNQTGKQTKEYENYILKCLVNSTVKDVALKNKTTEDIIDGIIERKISTEIDWNNISPIALGMDEIALEKGHNRYITLISDISSKGNVRILAVLEGRDKKTVLTFLNMIPDKIFNQLNAFCIDMGKGYVSALKERMGFQLFSKIVVTDRFHVSKLLSKIIDKERVKEMNILRKEFENDSAKLEEFKDTMWPYRKHWDDLSIEEQKKLEQLFDHSFLLNTMYQLKEELYQIFQKNHSVEDAGIKLDEWCDVAIFFKPFHTFVNTMNEHKSSILNYFKDRRSSGPVEGANNKVKVIKRRAFGFRNITNFARRLYFDFNFANEYLPAT